jgi:hypothetical protein
MIVAIVNFSLPQAMSVDKAREVFEGSAPGYQGIPGLRRTR